jgi:hypothetical protein
MDAMETILQSISPMPRPDYDSLWTHRAQVVFLVGSPRSGTTWLQAMLASHPSIASGPETHFFKMMSAVESTFSRKLPRPVGLDQYLSADEFYSIMADLFHQIASRVPPPQAPQGPLCYFLEKTPEHALYAPFILRCLPNARFIHLLRDGRHVAASLMRAHSHWDKPDSARYATVAIQVWQQCVLAARNIPDLLATRDHFREIRYEDLRQAPRQEMARLLDWLGLLTEDHMIEEIIARNDLETTRRNKRFDSITRPGREEGQSVQAEPEVFFGKGQVNPHSFDLTRLQEYQCYRIAGKLLEDLGYCSPCPPVPWWAKLACSWKLRTLLGLAPV